MGTGDSCNTWSTPTRKIKQHERGARANIVGAIQKYNLQREVGAPIVLAFTHGSQNFGQLKRSKTRVVDVLTRLDNPWVRINR